MESNLISLPLVTVIMPAYNSSKYITASINSILAQLFTDFELIIVDDCSTDNTVNIINSLGCKDSRIKLLSTTYNTGGPALPRNLAIRESRGQYLAFCDSDDLWRPDKLLLQIAIFKSNPHIKFLSNRISIISTSSHNLLAPSLLSVFILDLIRRFRLLPLPLFYFSNFISLSSLVVHKSVFIYGFFNENPIYIAVEDFLFTRTLFENNCEYYFLNRTLSSWRNTSYSISSNQSSQLSKVILALSNYQSRSMIMNIFRILAIFYYQIRLFLSRN